jgi:hypothetical protein
LLLEAHNSWTTEGFERLFLEGLIEKYPEFTGMRNELQAARAAVAR